MQGRPRLFIIPLVTFCFPATMFYFDPWQREQQSVCCMCDRGLIHSHPHYGTAPSPRSPSASEASLNRSASASVPIHTRPQAQALHADGASVHPVYQLVQTQLLFNGSYSDLI